MLWKRFVPLLISPSFSLLRCLPLLPSFTLYFIIACTVCVMFRLFLSPSHLLSFLIFSVLSCFIRLRSNWCRWLSVLPWCALLLEVLTADHDWTRECFTWLHHVFEKSDFLTCCSVADEQYTCHDMVAYGRRHWSFKHKQLRCQLIDRRTDTSHSPLWSVLGSKYNIHWHLWPARSKSVPLTHCWKEGVLYNIILILLFSNKVTTTSRRKRPPILWIIY